MKTLATIMILALVSFGILTPVIISYRDKRKLINEIKKKKQKIEIKKMDMKNGLIMKYILNELQELQRRCFEAQVKHFKIVIFGKDSEIQVEFSTPERSFIHYEFDPNYREEVLLQKLEELKKEIREMEQSNRIKQMIYD